MQRPRFHAALAAVIFVALNIAADATLTTTRLDLTENGRYTLAAGTKNIVRNLKEPIVLKFFFSKSEPPSSRSKDWAMCARADGSSA